MDGFDGVLLLLLIGAFKYAYGKASREDVCEMKTNIQHISNRVDDIYRHLLGGKK